MTAPTTVNEYLAGFSDDVRTILENVREAIRKVIPDADERMSYGIVRLEIAGRHAIYFGGWKKHVGLYPIPVLDDELEQLVAPYRAAKDSVYFSYAKPIPYDLIERVTAHIAGR